MTILSPLIDTRRYQHVMHDARNKRIPASFPSRQLHPLTSMIISFSLFFSIILSLSPSFFTDVRDPSKRRWAVSIIRLRDPDCFPRLEIHVHQRWKDEERSCEGTNEGCYLPCKLTLLNVKIFPTTVRVDERLRKLYIAEICCFINRTFEKINSL